MKKDTKPKAGDKQIYCTECKTDIRFLSADMTGKVKVVDNGKTIPKHYSFGIDLMGKGRVVSWLCPGSGQTQVTHIYQPTKWDTHGTGYRFHYKPEGWKPKPTNKTNK